MFEDRKQMQDKTSSKSKIAEREENILKFWQENKIFEKTLSKKPLKGEFTFYDGPPFATGLPHYGHILVSIIKDVIPRYRTMLGYKVSRRWGWDCHGLPIENIVEKDLKISGRKQIMAYGVEKFNEYARSKVLTYVSEWKKTVDRIGRFVDFDGSYKTMDNSYIESVWWALKELHKKGLIYEGTRVLPYCPRCETPIANSEIAMDNSYKEISDISVYVKFPLKEGDKYFLAWTTTPWTLPGNFALAVNPKAVYVIVEVSVEGDKKEKLILAKERLSIFKEKVNVVAEMSGQELVGVEYRPVFDYFVNQIFPNKEKAWKVYPAEFVTMSDGTGIVHIAPGYGEEDMNLAKQNDIPFIHHVDSEGKFTDAVKDFAGKQVKPKGNHQETDVEVLKYLADKHLLFGKEKINHSYPHCYRCETPLYYYAIPAWFIKIQGIKDKLLTLNESINWIPEYLKNGRFKNGIEGAPDWNISRNRFWASPLPFWKCNKCGHLKVCGGLDEIKQKPKNNYVFIRHGESENNVLQVVSSRLDSPHRLTQKGKEQIKEAALKLKDTRWDFIYYSPLLRTKESALILSQILGVPNEKVIADERLREIQIEKFEGKSIDEYRQSVGQDDDEKRFEDSDVVESFYSIKKRIGSFIAEMESKYQSLNILVVAHDTIVWMAQSVAGLMDKKQTLALRANRDFAVKNGDYRKISLLLAPHNANYELDLHRPYIDNFGVYCQCGNLMKRVEEVIDCWFESASMPFASNHYPFENTNWLQSGFPADFVAEYVPQTRTWFYYMHVVSTILFGRAPFRNVLTHGTILAEDGQKMSKSKGNFPDPWIMFNKYGVDALRFYLLSSPVMKAEDVNFVEKDLDAVSKKVINRLENILSFYITYTNDKVVPRIERHNILDRWMSSRLSTLLIEVKKSLDNYFLDKATRSIDAFIEDLSVWYIRRSRDRFKSENNNESQEAINMTAFVLLTLSKVIAPIMPFIAEHIYKELKFTSAESIHLEKWPELSDFDRPDEKLLKEMSLVRQYCSEILEQRSRAGIKVRQPLSLAKIFDNPLPDDLTNLIIEETNIKKVEFVSTTDKKGDSAKVFIDTTITPALKKEGMVRELIRAIQDERKQKKLTVRDEVIVFIETDSDSKSVFEEAEEEIMNVTKAVSLVFSANLDIPAKDYGEFSAKIFVQKKS